MKLWDVENQRLRESPRAIPLRDCGRWGRSCDGGAHQDSNLEVTLGLCTDVCEVVGHREQVGGAIGWRAALAHGLHTDAARSRTWVSPLAVGRTLHLRTGVFSCSPGTARTSRGGRVSFYRKEVPAVLRTAVRGVEKIHYPTLRSMYTDYPRESQAAWISTPSMATIRRSSPWSTLVSSPPASRRASSAIRTLAFRRSVASVVVLPVTGSLPWE
jgi:hypothetical protein